MAGFNARAPKLVYGSVIWVGGTTDSGDPVRRLTKVENLAHANSQRFKYHDCCRLHALLMRPTAKSEVSGKRLVSLVDPIVAAGGQRRLLTYRGRVSKL